MTDNLSRRGFLKASGLTLSFSVAGQSMMLTPAQARENNADFQVFNSNQVATLETLAEAIVPGAKKDGIAHFLDAQLAAKTEDALLMIRYLSVPPPFSGFYTASLDAAESAIKARHKKSPEQLDQADLDAFIDEMAQGKIADWAGPPSDFFYFVFRSDAIDVVYGTEQGFAKLDIPYMAHIAPEQRW